MTPHDELRCEAVVQLITEYLDGALDPGDRRRLEAHLAGCEGCATVLAQFRATIDATGALAAGDVDALEPATRDDLLGAFRRWSAGQDPHEAPGR